MDTNEIREAILKKARDEAGRIVADAREKAKTLIEQAEMQKKELVEKEKEKRIAEAGREAAKRLAQSALKERQTILREKDGVIKSILARTREELAHSAMTDEQIGIFLTEIMDALATDQTIRLYVANKDRDAVQRYIDGEGGLKETIAEIREKDMLGGIIAETEDGMISIDDSYERRLDMLMPRILPEIGRTLFGS